MTLPNIFTLLRILLMPVFILVFYWPLKWANVLCAVIFAFAAFTDWIDGYLARRLQQQSAFGRFFDPVADKLIVSIALVLLVGKHGTAWLAVPATVIICREILVSALREWMAELGKRQNISVSMLGKVKAFAQMLAVVLLLLAKTHVDLENVVVIIGYTALYVAALLTLWSMLIYLRAAWPSLALKSH